MQIPGNEYADLAAKNALNAPLTVTPNLLFSDIKRFLKAELSQKDSNIDRNLSHWYTNISQNYPTVNQYLKINAKSLSRENQTKIIRLRLGHTRLTHKHLMDKNLSNTCNYCNAYPTNVEHILDKCTYFDVHRESLPCACPSDLLKNPSVDNLKTLINYLKYCNLYNEI